MIQKKYKIEYTASSRNDVRAMKKYILDNFKYRELANNFTKKIKKIANTLRIWPSSYTDTGLEYRGHNVYIKAGHTYIFLYTVDEEKGVVTVLRILQDGMNWQFIIKQWLRTHSSHNS